MHLLLLLLTLLAPAATIGPWPYPTTHVLHHVVVVGKIDCFVPPPTGLIGTYLPTVYNSVSLRYGAFNRTDELAKWRAAAPADSGSENEQGFVVVGNYTTSEGVGGVYIPNQLSLHVDAPFCGKRVINFWTLKPTYSGDLRADGEKNADPYFKEKLEVYSLGRINMNQHGSITKD